MSDRTDLWRLAVVDMPLCNLMLLQTVLEQDVLVWLSRPGIPTHSGGYRYHCRSGEAGAEERIIDRD